MADTAKRLSGPTALTTSAVTQYTVPASTTTIIRHIHAVNESASTATFRVSIGTDGAGKRIVMDQPLSPTGTGSAYDWSGFLVLATTEVIQALASAGTAIPLVISGVEVT